MTEIEPKIARDALANLPEATSYGDEPALEDVYLPRSHLSAMDLNVSLVTGMRGSGKTFWWSALQRPEVRRLIDHSSGRSVLKKSTQVKTGFGDTPAPDDYPAPHILGQLMKEEREPRAVWRTVVAYQLAQDGHPLRRKKSWPSRVTWADSNPEAIDRLLYECDRELDSQNLHSLVLFDALDKASPDWNVMYRAVRGLLQVALDMRSYRRLRVKIFLRSDQSGAARVADFPDVSKILSSSVELSWPRRELYGLLWHCLANGDAGRRFQKFFGGRWKPVCKDTESAFQVPRKLVEEDNQREKFHRLSGPFMGTNHRRGYPYSWIPTHLGDSEGRASPRSFLAALRMAALDTRERYPTHRYALHYEGVKSGVQKASTTRVNEIREDHRWIHHVLEPLEGMSVPVEFHDIRKRWRNKKVLEALARDIEKKEIELPPRHMDDGPRGIREDLEAAGVFQRLFDDRVNIPDIFRLGYGMGRKGGVKQVR